MHWYLLVVCLCLVGRQAVQEKNFAANKVSGPRDGDKGFYEWITGLFGTTASPIISEPVVIPTNCPACQCGVALTRRRIVGGQETKERQYPWMVMLLYNGRMFCGGSLINDLYVMTAAHCTGFRKDRMTVRLLEHDVTSHVNKSKVLDIKVAKVIRHLRYNPGNYDNDIALLKLEERIDLSHAIKKRIRSRAEDEEGSTTAATVATSEAEASPTTTATTTTTTTTESPATTVEDVYVRPVCLPEGGISYTDDIGLVTGWGYTEDGGSVSSTLQEVKVPIVSNKECSDRSYGMRVTDNMLCAGDPSGGRDACQGDSGGPLHVLNEKSSRYHEVGVVSWGEGCALPSKYGVYSRVNRYLTWIKSNTVDACYCDPN